MTVHPESIGEARTRALADTFPTLRGAIKSWDPQRLARWASSSERCSAARHAARFVLSVWDPYGEWECGPFNLHLALQCWDDKHRAAFLTWVKNPWWP